MKSLLVCSSTFPLGENDRRTARFVYDLATALARRYDVTALAPHHPGAVRTERLGAVNVRRFPYFFPTRAERLADGTGVMANVKRNWFAAAQAPFFLTAFRAAARNLLRRERFDVVNTHWLVPAGWAAGPAARRAGAKHLVTVHAADVFLLRRLPGGAALARRVLATGDAVFADSRFIIDELSRLVGREVAAVPTTAGVDAAAFAPRYSPDDAKKELGWPPRPALLYVGKMVEKKGLAYLIPAMKEVARAIPDATLTLAGDGPTRAATEAQVREYRLEKVVRFVGPKNHAELKLMYNAADALVIPSIVARDGETEGMPTVILEAFAAGCPAVGSRVAGIPEFIRDGETGFLAEPQDPASLAAAIITTLCAGRDRFRAGCRAAAAERDFTRLAEIYAAAAED